MTRHIKIVSTQNPGEAVNKVNELLAAGFSIDARLIASVSRVDSAGRRDDSFIVPEYIFVLSKYSDDGNGE